MWCVRRVVREHRGVHDVLRVVLQLTEFRGFSSEIEMKPHFASLQHFLKFKQHYKHNHFLNNQVTADLKKRRENEHNALKKRLLENHMYVQNSKKMCCENKEQENRTWTGKPEGTT